MHGEVGARCSHLVSLASTPPTPKRTPSPICAGVESCFGFFWETTKDKKSRSEGVSFEMTLSWYRKQVSFVEENSVRTPQSGIPEAVPPHAQQGVMGWGAEQPLPLPQGWG